VFNNNSLSILLTTKEAVKHYSTEGGSVINIGSIAAQMAPAGSSIYAAAKGTADIITKSLSKELAPKKIRVNSITPGLVETEGGRDTGILGTPVEEMVLSMTQLGRIGQPDDIADVAVFLASEESRFMTGEIVRVTGGLF